MVIDLWIYYHVASNMVIDPWIYDHVASNMVLDPRINYQVARNILVNPWLGRPEPDQLRGMGCGAAKIKMSFDKNDAGSCKNKWRS